MSCKAAFAFAEGGSFASRLHLQDRQRSPLCRPAGPAGPAPWRRHGKIAEPCLLITYTTGFGQAPPEVLRFVENNRHLIVGVAASGNRNWGANFARAADLLAERYGIRVIHKFELSGTARDIEIIKEAIHALSGTEQCAVA